MLCEFIDFHTQMNCTMFPFVDRLLLVRCCSGCTTVRVLLLPAYVMVVVVVVTADRHATDKRHIITSSHVVAITDVDFL